MPDYRSMFDQTYIGAWDLDGKDITVVIARFEAGKVKNKEAETRKIILFFEDSKTGKGMVVNKTNARTIAGMYGKDVSKWIGRAITLYATTTQVGRDTVDCIRVRPEVPTNGARNGRRGAASPASTPDSEAPDAA